MTSPRVARQAGTYGRFDTVVHNAGAMNQPHQATVNVVAPYLLTALMDKPGRLIYLSSSMHRTGSAGLHRLRRPAPAPPACAGWPRALRALRQAATNPRISAFREHIARACDKTPQTLRGEA
ncbi:hypothetical protein [Streptomyces sp. NBC_00576]|uniref:hypothetical protein n=1 Tax=Streptomyces sp. NBC_00576 TaxID=2903665 RepID=UPI002E81A654|nr:hypothetical protein [Streptomyces sp. NBC_00576]WUB68725.1 hypothetical protein OG734_00605 [Streptomyces sp. NBC_00576]